MASLILWTGIQGPLFRQPAVFQRFWPDQLSGQWIPDFEFGYLSVGENIRRHFDSNTSLVLRKNRKVSTNIVSQSILRIYFKMLVANVCDGRWWRPSVTNVGRLMSTKIWLSPKSFCSAQISYPEFVWFHFEQFWFDLHFVGFKYAAHFSPWLLANQSERKLRLSLNPD